MARDHEKQRVLSRRAVIFGGLQLAAFSVLAGRLGYLQFVRSDEYATLSENNRIKLQLVTPERGHLLDRHGEKLAANQKNFRLLLDRSGLTSSLYHATLDRLRGLVSMPEKRWQALRALRVPSTAAPELIQEHMTWEDVSKIELQSLDLAGVLIDVGQLREYLLGDAAAHLLGYVGAVAQSDLSEDSPPLMRLPDFKVGKNGVEKALEERLRGTAGIRQLEVNVHGVSVREISRKDSVPGENIRLTVDKELQSYAASLVRNESAGVVVMEVDTGNLLALVSMPGFDPESFSKGISSAEWKTLNDNKRAPLLNKAIGGQYPPGSTFKMAVGMAALEAGIISPSTTVHCPGYFYLGDHQFKCWKEGGHGTVRYHEAIAQSCDTFFYTVAQRAGIDRYADLARTLGLGAVHDLGITGEQPGIIPDPEWKKKRYQTKWTGGDTINCGIGQGYVLATPLQLAVMTARIASGNMVAPRLWVEEGQEQPVFEPLMLKPETLEATRDAMTAVVNSPIGTAYGRRIADPRFAYAGKTGTSQVRAISERGVNQATLPWEFRHHALFVGYAPLDKPKYACCVAIEHGGGGAAAAAPVARDVLLKAQELSVASR